MHRFLCRDAVAPCAPIALVLLVAAAPAAAQELRWTDADARRVEQLLQSETGTTGFPGVCAGVVSLHAAPLIATAGYADLASRRPFTINSVQPVASVSKTLIGYLVARAAARGQLVLDSAPALPFAVGQRAGDAAPTWRQLATHTADIVDREAGYARAYLSPTSPDTGLRAFLAAYLDPAGTLYHPSHVRPATRQARYEYSNIGAALAGYALERVTGESYATLAAREIFGPLSFTQSRFFPLPASRDDATMYNATRSVVAPYALATYPDGAWHTSCSELSSYLSAVLRAHRGLPSPLDSTAVRLMLTPQFTAASRPRDLSERETNLGLFWSFRRQGIGHSGGDLGVTAFILVDPAAGVGRLFMTNIDISEGPEAAALTERFTRIWTQLATFQPPRPEPRSALPPPNRDPVLLLQQHTLR